MYTFIFNSVVGINNLENCEKPTSLRCVCNNKIQVKAFIESSSQFIILIEPFINYKNQLMCTTSLK